MISEFYPQTVWFSSSGGGAWEPAFLKEFPGEANVAGPGTTRENHCFNPFSGSRVPENQAVLWEKTVT